MNGKRGRRLQRERECQGEYRGYDCIPFSELFRSGCHLISSPLGEGVLAPLHLEEGILAPLHCRVARLPTGADEARRRPASRGNRSHLTPSFRSLANRGPLVAAQKSPFGRGALLGSQGRVKRIFKGLLARRHDRESSAAGSFVPSRSLP